MTSWFKAREIRKMDLSAKEAETGRAASEIRRLLHANQEKLRRCPSQGVRRQVNVCVWRSGDR